MRKLLVLTLIFSACGGAEVAEEPTTTTTTVKETTTTSSSTTTTVVKEAQAEPSIEFVNCVDTVITDETYELTYDVIAGNEDMNYFFVSTYKNGEYVNRAYFDKENNPGVGLFPLANTSGRYGSLVDNSDGSGTDIYEITISVSDEGDGSADAVCTLTMRNESNTTTTVGESKPDNPGDTKNCGDFDNYSDAKAWFDTYYPYYGDVAKLDRDENLIPCESLPGAP